MAFMLHYTQAWNSLGLAMPLFRAPEYMVFVLGGKIEMSVFDEVHFAVILNGVLIPVIHSNKH